MKKTAKTRLAHPATAKDVAERAGLTVFTVSRVFSGSPVVSRKTVERVLTIAAELGYSPNVAARALRTGKVEVIGLVQPAHCMRGEFFSEILAGVQAAVSERQLDILLSSVPPGIMAEDWIRKLKSTGRCGAIALLMEIHEPALLKRLKELAIPSVALNYAPASGKCAISCAGFDNAQGVIQGVHHLYDLGHRDIAFIGCHPLWGDGLRRQAGFLTGMSDVGLPVSDHWMLPYTAGDAPGFGAQAMRRLLKKSAPRPTAVVCASDDIALGALGAARDLGIRIPQDVSIVGFDDNAWTSFYTPPLTTIRHRGWDLGQAGGKLLLESWDKPTHARSILLPTELVVRETTAPPTTAPAERKMKIARAIAGSQPRCSECPL